MKLKAQMFLSVFVASSLAVAFPVVGRSQVSSNPTFTSISSFYGTEGTGPNGKLLVSYDNNGNTLLFGTNYNGGDANNDGTVFELKPTKHNPMPTPIVIHTFAGGASGSHPAAGLVMDSSGSLYGTAAGTGTTTGIAFQLVPPVAPSTTWTYNVIHTFGTYPDGADPNCDLLYLGGAGNEIAGTTVRGGIFDEGTAFLMSESAQGVWTEKVIHDFQGNAGGEGSRPYSGLVIDSANNLYGTTGAGGANFYGTLFKLSPPTSGTFWPLTNLFNFGADPGKFPLSGVYMDNAGNFFGTTYVGGGSSYGEVYEISPGSSGYTASAIFAFTSADGANPSDVPTPDGSGGFYLTTGAARTTTGGNVVHLVPPVAPSTTWTGTVLYSFTGGVDGQAPLASVVLDRTGTILYGTTFYGGAYGGGTAFQLK